MRRSPRPPIRLCVPDRDPSSSPLKKFYPAEKYPLRTISAGTPTKPYCQVNIIPKIQALKIKLQNDPLTPPKQTSEKK